MSDIIVIADPTSALIIDSDQSSEALVPSLIPAVVAALGTAIPIQNITSAGPSLVLDYSLGTHVVLILTGNITSLSFINWAPSGKLSRLTIKVKNTGSFSITGFPSQTKWAGSTPPATTGGSGAIDWLAFTTDDAGTSLEGHNIGQNYN